MKIYLMRDSLKTSSCFDSIDELKNYAQDPERKFPYFIDGASHYLSTQNIYIDFLGCGQFIEFQTNTVSKENDYSVLARMKKFIELTLENESAMSLSH